MNEFTRKERGHARLPDLYLFHAPFVLPELKVNPTVLIQAWEVLVWRHISGGHQYGMGWR